MMSYILYYQGMNANVQNAVSISSLATRNLILLTLLFHYKNVNYIIQIYSGITSGRVLDGELLYTKILEVNLVAFALNYLLLNF